MHLTYLNNIFFIPLCINVNNDNDFDLSLLNYCEIQQLNYYSSDKRKSEFYWGRICAKTALRVSFPDLKFSGIDIGKGVFNQPLVKNPAEISGYKLSISHTNTIYSAMVFPDEFLMGLDIEKRNNESDKVIYKALTDKEKLLIDNEGFLPIDLWTIKESISKAILTGFSVGLDIFEIDTIVRKNQYLVSTFIHFPLFKTYTFNLFECSISITVPKQVEFEYF